jgi:hypothetical protein
MDLKSNVTIELQPSEAIQLLKVFRQLNHEGIVPKCEEQLENTLTSFPIDVFRDREEILELVEVMKATRSPKNYFFKTQN